MPPRPTRRLPTTGHKPLHVYHGGHWRKLVAGKQANRHCAREWLQNSKESAEKAPFHRQRANNGGKAQPNVPHDGRQMKARKKARQREKHMPRPANQHKACRPGHNFILSAWQYQRCQPHHFNGPNAATGQRKTPWPRPPMPLIPPPSAPDGDIRPAPPRATQGRPRVAPGGSRQEKPSGKTPLGRSTASTSA